MDTYVFCVHIRGLLELVEFSSELVVRVVVAFQILFTEPILGQAEDIGLVLAGLRDEVDFEAGLLQAVERMHGLVFIRIESIV